MPRSPRRRLWRNWKTAGNVVRGGRKLSLVEPEDDGSGLDAEVGPDSGPDDLSRAGLLLESPPADGPPLVGMEVAGLPQEAGLEDGRPASLRTCRRLTLFRGHGAES